MSFDPFASSGDSLIAPAQTAFAIVPDDTADLPGATKAVYVGGGGDLTARLINASQDVTFGALAPGTILPIRLRAVRATGTTATALLGLA